jgi:acyl-CoA reductase-like NAD-dependent aldehyde dehydrogenase
MSVVRRTELLHAVADEINRRFDDFLEAELADTGKPRSLASHIDIPRGVRGVDSGVDLGLTRFMDQADHGVGCRVAVLEGLAGGDELAVDEVVELFHGA